jgi:hypothetical protein
MRNLVSSEVEELELELLKSSAPSASRLLRLLQEREKFHRALLLIEEMEPWRTVQGAQSIIERVLRDDKV